MKSCFFIKKFIFKICLFTIFITFISSCTAIKNTFPSGYAFFNNSLGFDEEFDSKDLERIKNKKDDEKNIKIENEKKITNEYNQKNIKTKQEVNKNETIDKENKVNKLKEKDNKKIDYNINKNKKNNQLINEQRKIKEENNKKSTGQTNQNKNIDNKKDNKNVKIKKADSNTNKENNSNIYYQKPTEDKINNPKKENNEKQTTLSKEKVNIENTIINDDKQENKHEYNNVNKIRNNKAKYKNFAIVVSGPSGVGKTTIVNELIKRNNNIVSSISATTRQKRNNEKDGIDYYFITNDKFQELALNNEFLEYSTNYNNSYGTPKRNYFDTVDEGKDIVFTLNLDGMLNIKNNKNVDVVSIYILPSTFEELEKRLRERKTETKEQLEKRLKSAQNEINRANGLYDYIVYNYDLENAIATVNAIYLAEQRKREIVE